jgi:hypothetical protein
MAAFSTWSLPLGYIAAWYVVEPHTVRPSVRPGGFVDFPPQDAGGLRDPDSVRRLERCPVKRLSPSSAPLPARPVALSPLWRAGSPVLVEAMCKTKPRKSDDLPILRTTVLILVLFPSLAVFLVYIAWK